MSGASGFPKYRSLSRDSRGGERAGVTEKVWDTGAGVCRGGVEGRSCLITQPWTAGAHSLLTRLCGFFHCATGGPLDGLQDGGCGLGPEGTGCSESNRVTESSKTNFLFWRRKSSSGKTGLAWASPLRVISSNRVCLALR